MSRRTILLDDHAHEYRRTTGRLGVIMLVFLALFSGLGYVGDLLLVVIFPHTTGKSFTVVIELIDSQSTITFQSASRTRGSAMQAVKATVAANRMDNSTYLKIVRAVEGVVRRFSRRIIFQMRRWVGALTTKLD